MILYCLTKDPKSMLCQIQQRIWREFDPQSEFVAVQTPNAMVSPIVNKCLNTLKATGHRYMVAFHEDCIPLRKMDPAELLKGKTFAARVNLNGGPWPSRTWLMADCQTEGMTVSPYGERKLTLDDVPGVPPNLLSQFRYLEPGWLHLGKWYKNKEDNPARLQKRDWILSHFSDYAELPKLTARIRSFAKAAATHVGRGFPHVPLPAWQERMAICDSCDAYDAATRRCRHCGCGIKTKSRWRGQDCPIGRWPAVVEEVEDVELSD